MVSTIAPTGQTNRPIIYAKVSCLGVKTVFLLLIIFVSDNDTGTILGLEVTWFVVVVISTLLILLVLIVAVSVCVCRRGSWNNRHGNSVQQQNASYSRKFNLIYLPKYCVKFN